MAENVSSSMSFTHANVHIGVSGPNRDKWIAWMELTDKFRLVAITSPMSSNAVVSNRFFKDDLEAYAYARQICEKLHAAAGNAGDVTVYTSPAEGGKLTGIVRIVDEWFLLDKQGADSQHEAFTVDTSEELKQVVGRILSVVTFLDPRVLVHLSNLPPFTNNLMPIMGNSTGSACKPRATGNLSSAKREF